MAEPQTRTFSGVERAAVIVLTLKEDVAAEVLKFFDADEVTQLSIAMVRLRSLSATSIEGVVDGFLGALEKQSFVTGGLEHAEKLLRKIFPEDQVAAILAEVSNVTGVDIWRKLANVDRGLLVGYLKGEHPQTAALILSQLVPELSARLLRSFDRSTASDVISRMLRLQPVQSEALGRVEEALRIEFLDATAKRRRQDRHAGMAEIFNNFDSRTEGELMGELMRASPDSAEKVQLLMFTFKDLLRMDPASIQTIIQQADRDVMSRALRTADEALKALFFANMSARAVKRMEDDWGGMAPQGRAETESAQSALLKTAKELIAKGEIRSGRERDDDDDIDM